jgi:hypothetical protein
MQRNINDKEFGKDVEHEALFNPHVEIMKVKAKYIERIL